MTSYQVRNNQQDRYVYPPRQEKQSEASTTSRTVDTLQSGQSMSEHRSVSEKIVVNGTDDVMCTANAYRESSRRGAGGLPKAGSLERKRNSFDMDPAEDSEGADESKTHWVENPTDDQVSFSIEEVKRMVLESIPKDVRDMIPPEAWSRILNKASDPVLSEGIMSLQKTATEEDVNDLISYISVCVQREAKGRPRADSDVSEMSYPNVEPPRRASLMDNVALNLDASPSSSLAGVKKEIAQEKSIDAFAESKKSRRASANGDESRPVAVAAVTAKSRPEALGPKLAADNTRKMAHEIEVPLVVPAQASDGRKIGFSHVEVRYYEQILADNPAVTTGPPIGIGWKYRIMKKDMSVDAWEHRQSPHRRYLTALVVTRHDRTNILYDIGYNQKQIAVAVREVLRVKNNRKQTYNNIRFQSMEEMVEELYRRFKNALTLGFVGRKQRQLLAPYLNGKSSY